MTGPSVERILGQDFPELFATIPAPLPLEQQRGIIDVTAETIADRDVVAKVRQELAAMERAR